MPLTVKQRFCEGEMTARFVRVPEGNDPLILAVPGGPGLSGRYLDGFLENLSRRAGINAGLLDLPNHDESVVSPSKLPLSYEECLKLVGAAIAEIGSRCGALFLFGQSFGARLVFDFLAGSKQPIQGVILTGFPYVFLNSSALGERVQSLEMEAESGADLEGIFARNWVKILRLATRHPLSDEIFSKLASGTHWRGNENILPSAPLISDTVDRLAGVRLPPIAILEGEFDEIVPDENWEMLKEIIPSAQFQRVPDAGHFVMVEKPDLVLNAFTSFIAGAGKA